MIFGLSGLKDRIGKTGEGVNLREGDWRDTFSLIRVLDSYVEMLMRELDREVWSL